MSNRVTLMAPIVPYASYGILAIQYARALAQGGNHVSLRPMSQDEGFGSKIPNDIRAMFVNCVQPEEWEILLHPPNFSPTRGKRTAYFTMWEATRLPVKGVDFLNQAELVIVPNQWNASCFSAQGVDTPIRVVPLGIDPEIFKYVPVNQNRPLGIDKKPVRCVFGAAGRLAHGGVRKGINEVIDAFTETFKGVKDVMLKVKCFPDCDVKQIKDKRIIICRDYLTDEQMAQWYASLDCFVSASRSEGWGLMQHQAMAVGRPVIGIKFGGVAEFFDETVGFVIPHTMERAGGLYATTGGHWAKPDECCLCGRMEHAFELARDGGIEVIGAEASKRAHKFRWKESQHHFQHALREFGIIPRLSSLY